MIRHTLNHTYPTNRRPRIDLSQITGFRPVSVGGKLAYRFEYAGIVTHCRPLPYVAGIQVVIIGCENRAIEIVQSDANVLLAELVSMLARIAPEFHRQRVLRNNRMGHLI
jgi:hypothetical protein